MKSYVASRGWLFPFKGGPHEGNEYRLPYYAKRDNVVENLPREIRFRDGSTYRIQPKFMADGTTRAMASIGKGQKVPAWEYVYVDKLNDILAEAVGQRLEGQDNE